MAAAQNSTIVQGRDGPLGVIDPQHSQGDWVALVTTAGQGVWLDRRALRPTVDGHYSVDLSRADVLRMPPGSVAGPTQARPATTASSASATTRSADGGDAQGESSSTTVVIPVIREDVVVDKRVVDTGGVRVTKHVDETIEHVSVPVRREELEVERVVIQKFVDQPPTVRAEGSTLIVPVTKEVLVVEKRLLLEEEVHIKKRLVVENSPPQDVAVRGESVRLERLEPAARPDHPQR